MMKKIWIIIAGLISGSACAQGGMGISKGDSYAPNDKAVLDIKSTEAGVLFPRLTTAQRNAISVAAQENGLLIYNTDEKCFNYYSAQSNSWKQMCGIAVSFRATTQNTTPKD